MSYAGDLAPATAWDHIAAGAVLVDVRTEGEWTHIGVPDTSALNTEPVFIQWNLANGSNNPQFLAELLQAVPTEKSLVVLCRSGARSIAAATAATAAGYTAYNVLEGFEGEPDRYGDRVVNGWKNRKLPWR
ncbi:Rhodanese-related sulfurtransferase [Arthrobacter alpinus]|uniref:Rhodanese-related sulfurtransferase n=1 Tax=Arthrobacter alpinus TaxID=656366 RepID=A0A0U3PCD9_9MICC|nr:rhodanese-like domain-containing protein [Arthrobacter alpinus]ALV46927.1 sulfurtransferase [Arthrobacter alpinus]SEE90735.1 Rhodanese-related sulfurtransferase [Arthrobacter alpinus]